MQQLNGSRNRVYKTEQVVVLETGPWATAVHALLLHLENVGFAGAPRVVGTGFDQAKRETLSFIDGEFIQPGPWSLQGAYALGQFLRTLHTATSTFIPPANAEWQRWFARELGDGQRVISHCDVAPWNIVARNGLPYALIDWEFAGPVDPLVELAQACWLNAKLHDDIVAEIEGLPPIEERAQQLRAIVDGYELPVQERHGFINRIIDFVMLDTAEQADEAGIGRETVSVDFATLGFNPMWALAWRARAGAWIVRNRCILERALV